jgi:ligand-binding sensor protein
LKVWNVDVLEDMNQMKDSLLRELDSIEKIDVERRRYSEDREKLVKGIRQKKYLLEKR